MLGNLFVEMNEYADQANRTSRVQFQVCDNWNTAFAIAGVHVWPDTEDDKTKSRTARILVKYAQNDSDRNIWFLDAAYLEWDPGKQTARRWIDPELCLRFKRSQVREKYQPAFPPEQQSRRWVEEEEWHENKYVSMMEVPETLNSELLDGSL